MARRGDGLYLRNKKTWYVDFRHKGRRHIVRLGSHIARSAARELATATRTRVLKGELGIGGPVAITVQDYAARWLRQIDGHVAPKTWSGYREMLDFYILPALGKVTLGALDRKQVRSLLAAQQARGMSANTLRLIRGTLSVLCGDAIEDGFATINPAQGLSRKGRSGPGTIRQVDRQREIRPLSVEQLAQFLAEVEAVKDRAWEADRVPYEPLLFHTMAATGMRPGETLALKWDDLDSADATLTVERALSGTTIKLTKTRSRRRVDLTPELVAALEDRQALEEAEAQLRGREPSPWIFTDPAGRLLDVKAVGRRFRRLVRRAGLPRFRLYDLRHSFASHLLALGAPITYVADQMGHSTPNTTLTRYAHWLPTADRSWITKLAQVRRADSRPDSRPSRILRESVEKTPR